MPAEVKVEHLGLMDYQQCWEYQELLNKKAVDQKFYNRKHNLPPSEGVENTVLVVEHPHVYTLGKSGKRAHLLVDENELQRLGAQFYPINRGGDITYHGFGQLVVYPILDLEQFFTDIHKYLRVLEEVVILTLSDFGIKAGRYEGYTGVWLDAENERARKICAMGIRCSRWITMHGLALNVNTNLDYFSHIVPCGIDDKAVTSIEAELNRKVDMKEVAGRLLAHLAAQFNMTFV